VPFPAGEQAEIKPFEPDLGNASGGKLDETKKMQPSPYQVAVFILRENIN